MTICKYWGSTVYTYILQWLALKLINCHRKGSFNWNFNWNLCWNLKGIYDVNGLNKICDRNASSPLWSLVKICASMTWSISCVITSTQPNHFISLAFHTEKKLQSFDPTFKDSNVYWPRAVELQSQSAKMSISKHIKHTSSFFSFHCYCLPKLRILRIGITIKRNQ